MTDKPKRKYTKRTASTENAPVAQPLEIKQWSPEVYHNAIDETVGQPLFTPPDITRRRSERPRDAKPEVEPVDVPRLDNLGSNEVAGLVEEAIYAHDMQDTFVRFDTVGRKWTFRPDQELGQTVFYIECAIPALTESLTISNSRFGLDGSRDEVKLAVEQLDEVVR